MRLVAQPQAGRHDAQPDDIRGVEDGRVIAEAVLDEDGAADFECRPDERVNLVLVHAVVGAPVA
jgi:hypothetical protein